MATTFQSGLKEYTGELDKYSMFLGGLAAIVTGKQIGRAHV